MQNEIINQTSVYQSPHGEKLIKEQYEMIIKSWPVPYDEQMIQTRYGETHVIVCGKSSSPSLLLLHGASSNALSWIGDIAEFSKYFRVYAVDVIGEPGKSAETRPTFDGIGYSEWLCDVLIGLTIDKTSIVGLSQGGWIALKLATNHPERIEKLVLLTPVGIVPTKASFLFRAIFYSILGKKGPDKLNRYVFGKQAIDPKALEFMNLIISNFKSRMDKEYIFTDTELSHLTMPVLLIGGTEDVIRSSRDIAKRLKNLASNLQIKLIPGMGHVLVNLADQIIPFLLS